MAEKPDPAYDRILKEVRELKGEFAFKLTTAQGLTHGNTASCNAGDNCSPATTDACKI
jgi:hypothetical protein